MRGCYCAITTDNAVSWVSDSKPYCHEINLKSVTGVRLNNLMNEKLRNNIQLYFVNFSEYTIKILTPEERLHTTKYESIRDVI